MRLCLHICCAPCTTVPHGILKEKFKIEGFFYNPNIQPASEYHSRKNALEKYTTFTKIKINYPEYNPEVFLEAVKGNEDKKLRCQICWRLRLTETAQFAKENNFDCFSTTLLISPYQDNEYLKNIGFEIGKDFNIHYFYQDFRPYFEESRILAKEYNLYMQNFCGCKYSQMERLDKKYKVSTLG